MILQINVGFCIIPSKIKWDRIPIKGPRPFSKFQIRAFLVSLRFFRGPFSGSVGWKVLGIIQVGSQRCNPRGREVMVTFI